MKVIRGKQVFETTNYSEIPDLWHIAHGQDEPVARDAILKAWYVAHAYMHAINKIGTHAEIDVTGS